MMKKKTLATLLTLTMLTTAAVPVFAAGEAGNSTTLTYTVASDYQVVIPPDVPLSSENGTGDVTFQINNALIEFGKELNVSISESTNYADGKFHLSDGHENTIEYTIKKDGTDVAISTSFLTVKSGNTTGSAKLDFKTAEDAVITAAGDYTDKLTFNVATANSTN